MKTRQFNPIPIKILMPSFHKKIEENLNLFMETQEAPDNQNNFEQNELCWGYYHP